MDAGDGVAMIGPLLLFLVLILCGYYLTEVVKAKYDAYRKTELVYEGFEGAGTGASPQQSDTSLYTWQSDPQKIYDDFYASIYDQLTNQTQRTQAKTQLCLQLWKKPEEDVSSWSVLDAGCGTGIAAAEFAKAGVGNVVALDQSPSMISYGQKETLQKLKVPASAANNIRWRQDTLVNPAACGAGEFTHIVVFYFTLYYLQNQEEFFRHCHLWSKPGARLIVEVVNRYKFDPVLESASPFLGFSVQKYSQERVRKSNVAFNKFDYEAEFQLTGSKGEFYETFRFKDTKNVHRNKHVFKMPEIKEIVAMANTAGWTYEGYQDLRPLGFEYGYLLSFVKK